MKKSKIVLAVSIVMSIVMVVTGTFAWFTSRDQKTNHFETKAFNDGSVCLYELFTPPTDWKPGQCITKNVAAYNNGDQDALVRISFEETLKKLKANGAVAKLSTKTATDATWFPVKATINVSQLTSDSWSYMVASDFKDGVLPADCKILKKTTDLQGNKAHSFIIFYEISTGVYQKMSANFEIDAATGKVVMTNKQYWFYQGYTTTERDWAGKNEIVSGGTKAINAPTPYPTAAQAATIQLDQKIILGYGQVDFAAITAGKWYYNAGDGYFYYIGKVTPGMITPLLLQTVKLDSSADDSYALMSLDLHVLLEGIQNTQEALTAATGWNITNTALVNALKTYCAF